MGKKADRAKAAAKQLAAATLAMAKPRPQPPAQVRRYTIDSVQALAKIMKWDERQTRAAQEYNNACEVLASAGTGSLDMDRVSGGGSPSKTPTERHLEAAHLVQHADRVMGGYQADLVRKMVVQGMTTREIARLVFLSEAEGWRREVSFTVGEALTVLANEMFRPARGSTTRSWMSE